MAGHKAEDDDSQGIHGQTENSFIADNFQWLKMILVQQFLLKDEVEAIEKQRYNQEHIAEYLFALHNTIHTASGEEVPPE